MKNSFELLLENIRSIQSNNSSVVICIDGHCCAGKTTLASLLSETLGALVIHMDDYYLPMHKRCNNFLESIDGPIDQQRFIEEVVNPLKRHATSLYLQKFDCKSQRLLDIKEVSIPDIVIIEGSYSHHPLWSLNSFNVFVEIDKSTQLLRLNVREGDDHLMIFENIWLRLERQYQQYYQIKEKADFALTLE